MKDESLFQLMRDLSEQVDVSMVQAFILNKLCTIVFVKKGLKCHRLLNLLND